MDDHDSRAPEQSDEETLSGRIRETEDPVANSETRTVVDRTPTAAVAAAIDGEPGNERLGEQIGPYRLVAVLGQGGMGQVYRAEQLEPIKRDVALKLIRSEVLGRAAIHRFEAERQAMARMSHSNIARVFEAGDTESGQPYIVMELVRGEPIDVYCDRNRLGLNERLRIFAEVCQGIHHAHQKGILHRDIKPSNVIVAEGTPPVPKVIDFGIAKAMDDPLIEVTQMTREGMITGTPAYISPEALEARSGLDIDMRSDVYGLGALLYQLLTGLKPFGEEGESVVEVVLRVSRGELIPPSKRLEARERSQLEGIAARRNIGTHALIRHLKRDLDWVVLKAMAHKRDERYDSAAELAAEIGRYLRNEPLLAGPPSAVYRAGKFVRRHTAAVALSILLVLALTAGLVARGIEAERANLQAIAAEQAHREAEEVVDFMIELFEVSNPGEAMGNSITAREILDRGAERINRELADQPQTRARMMKTIGSVYRELGLFVPARELLTQALEQRRSAVPTVQIEIADAAKELGINYWEEGDYEQAIALLEEAVAIQEIELGAEHLSLAETLGNLASNYRLVSRVDEAEVLYRRALEIRTSALGKRSLPVAQSLNDLGILFHDSGRRDEATPYFEKALASRVQLLGEDHLIVAHSANGLAMVKAQDEPERAIELFSQALRIREKVLEPNHPDIAQALNNLSNVLVGLDRLDEAAPLSERAVQIYTASLGPDHYRVGVGIFNYADLQFRRGEDEQAESGFERALEIFENAQGHDHVNVSYPLQALGELYAEQDRIDEARAAFTRAISIREKGFGPDHDQTQNSRDALAELDGESG